ncbi:hypothetical protein [uncultured Aquimarina sp.]|uniref:hypothetical protein n=1 Tax=uncultured Aquimarina sp. TaxID=575652 RepID=UPI00262F3039|nr:hypothetical protein [uncultured Aquimarina sp.]
MNIFIKIKREIERRKALRDLYDDVKNLDEVLLEKRIEIFKEIVTPKFAEIGLNNWNGKYLWYSDFNNEGIKHVIQFHKFRGFKGTFSFGNCFYSVPTISGKKLVNHRTDKSTKIMYLKTLDGYLSKKIVNPDFVGTVNEKKFRDSLDQVLSRNIPKFEKWFLGKKTINENIAGLQVDINHPLAGVLDPLIISYEYILSFLYKQQKDPKSSEYWINKHLEKNLNSEMEKKLILERIKK